MGAAPAVKHRGSWFVYAGGERIPYQSTMRGQWGYDVVCSCGKWQSKTGGGTRASVQRAFDKHKLDEQWLDEVEDGLHDELLAREHLTREQVLRVHGRAS